MNFSKVLSSKKPLNRVFRKVTFNSPEEAKAAAIVAIKKYRSGISMEDLFEIKGSTVCVLRTDSLTRTVFLADSLLDQSGCKSSQGD